MTDPSGSVVVVAGATRGAGRGIAAAFGEVGATVVCTGRSSRAGRADVVSDYAGRPVYYDLAKVAVNRLGWSLGHELGPRGATALAVTPGWMRSELMLEAYGVTDLDGTVPDAWARH